MYGRPDTGKSWEQDCGQTQTFWCTEKTSFPFLFILNEIWSWWQIRPNGLPFGSKSKGKLSPLSYPIQYERKLKYSFLSVSKKFDFCKQSFPNFSNLPGIIKCLLRIIFNSFQYHPRFYVDQRSTYCNETCLLKKCIRVVVSWILDSISVFQNHSIIMIVLEASHCSDCTLAICPE